jgi:hypothetical protein
MGGLNKYQQIATLLKDMGNLVWKNSQIRGSNNFEDWIPVVNLSENETCLGIAKSGYWVLETGEYIVPLLENKILRDLLPCLKKSMSETVSLINEGLNDKGLPTDVRNNFPIRSLILSGLKFQSDFWASLALNWLESFPLDEEISAELRKLVIAKWASQKTRQRAKKFLASGKCSEPRDS